MIDKIDRFSGTYIDSLSFVKAQEFFISNFITFMNYHVPVRIPNVVM